MCIIECIFFSYTEQHAVCSRTSPLLCLSSLPSSTIFLFCAREGLLHCFDIVQDRKSPRNRSHVVDVYSCVITVYLLNQSNASLVSVLCTAVEREMTDWLNSILGFSTFFFLVCARFAFVEFTSPLWFRDSQSSRHLSMFYWSRFFIRNCTKAASLANAIKPLTST